MLLLKSFKVSFRTGLRDKSLELAAQTGDDVFERRINDKIFNRE